MKTLLRIVLLLFTTISALAKLTTKRIKHEEDILLDKHYKAHGLKLDIPIEEPLVTLEASPSNGESLTGNWTVSWNAVSTSVSWNSRIASYLFGQKPTADNAQTLFSINKRHSGNDQLPVPKNAGIWEIRYIQDNNLQTIATYGPIVVNPPNSNIELVKTTGIPGEFMKVKWKIPENSFKKYINDGFNPMLCVNVVGSYEDCIWSHAINSHIGLKNIRLPTFAGYFVIRIIASVKTWKFLPEEVCLAVSPLIKLTDPKFELRVNKTAVVASPLKVEWNFLKKEFDSTDWIGAFNINSPDVFTRSTEAIQSIKVSSRVGNLEVLLPPNSPAGSYIFIYFKNHVPTSVSDLINVQQPKVECPYKNATMSKIKHMVIICTENHSFDNYFGKYCKSPTGSNPTCNKGRDCCERAPEVVEGHKPFLLNDTQNFAFDPNHDQNCELCEINGGRMDGYFKGCYCSDERNFAVAEYNQTLAILHNYAERYSLADNYFQPSAGASSQNDMYLARASYVYKNNEKIPVGSVGSNCWYLVHGIPIEYTAYYDPSITSLLAKCGFTLRSYAEGYKNASLDFSKNKCYPDGYDAGDIPFNYYAGITDKKQYMADYQDFLGDIKNKTLPEVSFIKPLGKNTAHPGKANITDEVNFIKSAVDAVLNSEYSEDTLIVWVPDESGGYYDHVSPPSTNPVDNIPYGPRIPFLVLGKFAKKNYISHVEMEHSSIVKFIEWNWLNGQTGQLNTRDRNVNSIGDLIDPIEAGITVPN